MKRVVILLTAVLFFAGTLSAQQTEGPLIDFSLLTQDDATLMDYGQYAGASFTEAQKEAMKTSLAIENWKVEFTSSSRSIENSKYSYTKTAQSNEQGGAVMGVRLHFPPEHIYLKATIKPPFEIPGANSKFEEGKGVIRNVAAIKSIQVTVKGLNFPYTLNLILLGSDGREISLPFGSLRFDGWKKLVWNNPDYIDDVRNRVLRFYPLYPSSTQYIKFLGFRKDRDADHDGGDFVAYFKDVRVVYDLALPVTDTTDIDIDNEEVWGITKERETEKTRQEMLRFAEDAVLRKLESEKKAKEPFYDQADAAAAE